MRIPKFTGKSKEEIAKKIFKFVRDEVAWDVLPIVGPEKVLRRKPMAAICFDKALLFGFLCKRYGIKVRYVIAKVRMHTKVKELPPIALHVYPEVYLGRWHPVDVTFGKKEAKLVEMSKWNKLPFDVLEIKKRKKDFSKLELAFFNLLIKLLPMTKKIRKVIRKYRT